MPINWWTNEMWYTHTMRYIIWPWKECTDSCYHIDESWRHYIIKRSQTQKATYCHIRWLYLGDTARIGKSIEIESILVVARCWEGQGGVNANGYKVSSGGEEMFWK